MDLAAGRSSSIWNESFKLVVCCGRLPL